MNGMTNVIGPTIFAANLEVQLYATLLHNNKDKVDVKDLFNPE